MTSHLDPNHPQTRAKLSGVGLVAVILGAPTAVIGFCLFVSVFFTGFSGYDFDGIGQRAVIGILMAGIGGMVTTIGLKLLGFAHMGRIARYQAGEVMPVAKDSLRDASPVLNEVARGISQAVRGDAATAEKIRHSCGAWNDPGDQFCKGCGAPLQDTTCPKCGSINDPDARFCEKCGTSLASTKV